MELFNIKSFDFNQILYYPDIKVEKNKTTFITGNSGSGKSTLLKFLNGVHINDNIFFCGEKVSELNLIKHRREVLLCSQNVYLFEGSIRDNFDKFYSFLDKKPLTIDEIVHYLTICKINNFSVLDNVFTMSGGERQRIFIAICMSCLPKVLLLDEPTSALDEKTSYDLLHNIKKFAKTNEISLIIVSHNKKLVENFADNIIEIGDINAKYN